MLSYRLIGEAPHPMRIECRTVAAFRIPFLSRWRGAPQRGSTSRAPECLKYSGRILSSPRSAADLAAAPLQLIASIIPADGLPLAGGSG